MKKDAIKAKRKKKVAIYINYGSKVHYDAESNSQKPLWYIISYTASLLREHPEWEYVGIYIDNCDDKVRPLGRENFKVMLNNWMDNKIDSVITEDLLCRDVLDEIEEMRQNAS